MQGLFLRGSGSQAFSQVNGSTVGVTSTLHQSVALGQIQGDSMRQIYGGLEGPDRGTADTQFITDAGVLASGAFSVSAFQSSNSIGNGSSNYRIPLRIDLDSSYIVPTDTENRPINMAVRYLVRAAK